LPIVYLEHLQTCPHAGDYLQTCAERGQTKAFREKGGGGILFPEGNDGVTSS
jgi:hypothetical protein